MKVGVKDIVNVHLTEEELDKCIDNAKKIYKNIIDRSDLHSRDFLERYENVLLGEIAEYMVIKWLRNNNRYAISAVDKDSPDPDPGHDLILRSKEKGEIKCSVKSSLSVQIGPDKILSTFTLATKDNEIRDVNVQVCFWYKLKPKNGESRVSLPSLRNSAIICWLGRKDFQNKKFKKYNHENRESPDILLKDCRKMNDLLNLLD